MSSHSEKAEKTSDSDVGDSDVEIVYVGPKLSGNLMESSDTGSVKHGASGGSTYSSTAKVSNVLMSTTTTSITSTETIRVYANPHTKQGSFVSTESVFPGYRNPAIAIPNVQLIDSAAKIYEIENDLATGVQPGIITCSEVAGQKGKRGDRGMPKLGNFRIFRGNFRKWV